MLKNKTKVRTCRACGCTDEDCRQCIEKTGVPCHWVADDLCSACLDQDLVNEALKGLGSLKVFNKSLKKALGTDEITSDNLKKLFV